MNESLLLEESNNLELRSSKYSKFVTILLGMQKAIYILSLPFGILILAAINHSDFLNFQRQLEARNQEQATDMDNRLNNLSTRISNIGASNLVVRQGLETNREAINAIVSQYFVYNNQQNWIVANLGAIAQTLEAQRARLNLLNSKVGLPLMNSSFILRTTDAPLITNSVPALIPPVAASPAIPDKP